jgi:tetratricopeptide (TPR) repeat protein
VLVLKNTGLLYKIISVILCLFLAFEAHYILAYQTAEEINEVYDIAKEAYLDGDYIVAKGYLEFLKATLTDTKGRDALRGKIYLLLGATYEKIMYHNLALKHYCMAKEILGEGESIEGINLDILKIYKMPCETKSGMSVSYLVSQFVKGLNAYNEGNYEGARKIIELQMPVIKKLDGFKFLKGETYLILGAACEKLNDRKFAKKYYAESKEIIGEVDTVEGIQLANLRWYKWKSTDWEAVESKRKMKKGISGLLGLILSIGLFAGLIAYLFVFKKKHNPTVMQGEHTGQKRPILLDLQGPTEVFANSTHTYKAKGDDPDDDMIWIRFEWEYDTVDGKKIEGSWKSGRVPVNEWVSHNITWTNAKSGGFGLVRAYAEDKYLPDTDPDKDLRITFK